MRSTRIAPWAGTTLALLALVSALVACGGSAADKAGGAGPDKGGEPVVLSLASAIQGGQPGQLHAFAEAVARLSNGTLRVEFRDNWRAGDPAYEAGMIEDVKAGKVDMAWVGARVFDTLGVTDFQALVAPFLVDSHDLQSRVFEEGIPDEMLTGIEKLGLEAIGVLPGPMRALLGVTHSFTKPTDFLGQTVGIQDSEVARLTFEALGATARPVPSHAELDGLDAYEQQLGSIVGNEYRRAADSVTAGANLWPRPLVIFTSHAIFEGLSAEHQEVLRRAALESVPAALLASRNEDAEAAATLCAEEVAFVQPSDDDRAALEAAVAPVLDRIAADPAAGPFLVRIQALRSEIAAAATPAGLRCPQAPVTEPATTATTGTSAVDGVYTVEVSRDEWIDAVGLVGAVVPEELGGFTLTLQIADGRWRLDAQPDGWALVGAARMTGDTLELANESPDATPWRLRSSTYRDNLELEPEPGAQTPYWLGLKGWHRTGDADPAAIDPDLGPPDQPKTGVYRRTITQAELLRAGIAPGQEANYDGSSELAFSDGTARFSQDGAIDPPTRVTVDGDLLRFEWAEREWMMSVTSSLENGALRFSELHGFGADLGLIGIIGGPWEKVG